MKLIDLKLIDLLVRDLPDNGGWPEGVAYVTQDYCGKVNGYVKMPTITGKIWLVGGFDDYLFNEAEKETCCDWKTSIVTREQYEAALAASQQPEWRGEGLPPVGTECEWENDDKWLKVEVVFSSRWVIVIRSKENNVGFGVDAAIDLVKDKFVDLSFRPIRTEVERKREVFIENLMNEWLFLGHDAEQAAALYDAIAAGKIPGVKVV